MPSSTLQYTDATRLERLKALSGLLDDAFGIPGTNIRFGFDSLIGLVPGLGDAATALLSGYVIYEAWKMGVSRGLLTRMILNVGLDTVVGVIPAVGDLFDLAFKANKRNLGLLERWLNSRDR